MLPVDHRGSEDVARAHEAWKRGEPEGALAYLQAPDAEADATARALATEIARVSNAIERTLGEILGVVVAAPCTTPIELRTQRLRSALESRFGGEVGRETATPRQPSLLGSRDEIHAQLCATLPSEPGAIASLYARRDWVLVERGREGSDHWWLEQMICVPAGQPPVPRRELRRVVRHQAVRALRSALPILRLAVPAGLRRRLKRPLAPLLRRLGMGPAQSSPSAPSTT